MDTYHDPEMYNRRSIRLRDFDYTTGGAYFVTICTRERVPLFGEVRGDEMRLNDAGRLAQAMWVEIPAHFESVATDAFVVMPNHVHGIIVIVGSGVVGATHASPLRQPSGPPKRSIGAIVGSYKSAVSRKVNHWRNTPGAPVWQRNYYEHVIRNEADLERIRQYIIHNPAKWAEDPDNPAFRNNS